MTKARRRPLLEWADPLLWVSPSGETLHANQAFVTLAARLGVPADLASLFGPAASDLVAQTRSEGRALAFAPLAVGPRPRATYRISLDRCAPDGSLAALLIDVSTERAWRRQLVERDRVLTVLSDLAAALSGAIEFGDLAERIHEQTGRIMPARNFFIALYDRESRQISFPVCFEEGARLYPPPRPYANAVTEYLIRTRGPLIFNRDVIEQARVLGMDPIGRACCSFIGAPILIDGEAIGVIVMQDFDQNDAYDAYDLEALTIVAAQAAGAMQNTQLLGAARRAYSELSEAQARLLESERVRGVTETVGALNHEINNPLAAISGNVQLLLRKGSALPPEVRDKIEAILVAAHRIERVTSRMATLIQATSMPYPGQSAILDVHRSVARDEKTGTDG